MGRRWEDGCHPHAVGEAHAVETGEHLLRVDKTDEVVSQNVLDGHTHLLDGLSSCGFAHIKLVMI